MGQDLADIWSGNDRQFYKRRSGPYRFQDQGGSKLWSHFWRGFGVNGSSIDPAHAIENFQKAQDLSTRR
jgi:hypothetical protein